MKIVRIIALLLVLVSCFQIFSLSSDAAQLPPNEVEALRIIGEKLGKKEWKFKTDPCSGSREWITPITEFPSSIPRPDKYFNDTLACDCGFLNHTVCHVITISLKSQSLDGVLPPELVRLPYLRELDLARNYLSGQIPPEWGSTKLINITLLGNRLTGPIPNQIGNISTLEGLVLESNQLSGIIPEALGSLSQLRRLFLTSNNFSGTLPLSLGMLTSLERFRIGDNNFSGPIPHFIRNWSNLTELSIQASGLSGPIPSDIGLLTKLLDLRISDLNGASSTFPPLNNLKSLKQLILRSCNITGDLPGYLDHMTSLEILLVNVTSLLPSITRLVACRKSYDDQEDCHCITQPN